MEQARSALGLGIQGLGSLKGSGLGSRIGYGLGLIGLREFRLMGFRV